MLLLRREAFGAVRADGASLGAASWGAASALWAEPEERTETLGRFAWTWANKIFPLKGTFHCLF